ncbi:hypothetical protein Q5P01_018443 [Channa striata]|uniref:Uncharacterized protein n=1 Tax=Channa striata TaxID=64152 RepID=A0AA88S9S9_CHASR|nr:hypothetical protein Q5P01_018443 [Channa striata]
MTAELCQTNVKFCSGAVTAHRQSPRSRLSHRARAAPAYKCAAAPDAAPDIPTSPPPTTTSQRRKVETSNNHAFRTGNCYGITHHGVPPLRW